MLLPLPYHGDPATTNHPAHTSLARTLMRRIERYAAHFQRKRPVDLAFPGTLSLRTELHLACFACTELVQAKQPRRRREGGGLWRGYATGVRSYPPGTRRQRSFPPTLSPASPVFPHLAPSIPCFFSEGLAPIFLGWTRLMNKFKL